MYLSNVLHLILKFQIFTWRFDLNTHKGNKSMPIKQQYFLSSLTRHNTVRNVSNIIFRLYISFHFLSAFVFIFQVRPVLKYYDWQQCHPNNCKLSGCFNGYYFVLFARIVEILCNFIWYLRAITCISNAKTSSGIFLMLLNQRCRCV